MDSIEKPRSFDYEKDDNKDKNESPILSLPFNWCICIW